MDLPPPPELKDFPDQESFQEARGFWQARVGRIKGLAASPTAVSAASPVTSAATVRAPSRKPSA